MNRQVIDISNPPVVHGDYTNVTEDNIKHRIQQTEASLNDMKEYLRYLHWDQSVAAFNEKKREFITEVIQTAFNNIDHTNLCTQEWLDGFTQYMIMCAVPGNFRYEYGDFIDDDIHYTWIMNELGYGGDDYSHYGSEFKPESDGYGVKTLHQIIQDSNHINPSLCNDTFTEDATRFVLYHAAPKMINVLSPSQYPNFMTEGPTIHG